MSIRVYSWFKLGFFMAMNAPPLFVADKLSVAAGGVRLLAGVEVCLERGAWVGVAGPSGCGKSTLLRAVAGLSDASEGEIRLDGHTPGELGWPGFRRQVVLVAQKPVLLDGSVEDNLARPFSYRTAEGAYPQERAEGLLARLGLAGRMAQEARSLSVGQQQRVCLVRSLLLSPRVVLLDEPTSALDEAAAEAVLALLEELRAEGLGLLMVSHDRGQMERWCGRIVDLAPFSAREAVS